MWIDESTTWLTWAPESEKHHRRPGVAHHLEEDLLVLRVQQRLDEEHVEVALRGEVDHRFDRVDPTRRRLLGDGRVGPHTATRGSDRFEVRRTGLGADAWP